MLPKKKPTTDGKITIDHATPARRRNTDPYTYEGATGSSRHGEPAKAIPASDPFIPRRISSNEEDHEAYVEDYVHRWTKDRY